MNEELFGKMLKVIKQVHFFMSNEANYPEGTIGHTIATDCKEILSTIEKQNNEKNNSGGSQGANRNAS